MQPEQGVIERGTRLLQQNDHEDIARVAMQNPLLISRELNNRSLYHFIQHFWSLVSTHDFQPNWHIEYLCQELEKVAEKVARKEPRDHDIIINIPPGSTKTITCSIMFPVWCWTKWPNLRFICASYSAQLALENADYARELIRSTEFQQMYPELRVKEDKDTKSNFRIEKVIEASPGHRPRVVAGGNRYSTSVGGTLTGFHGDILIVDDPINPNQAVSEIELGNANRWMEQTLSTRKTNKAVTVTILIMQRLHQDDPSGHMLDKQKANLKHICIPGEARSYRKQVQPADLYKYYKDDLMDPNRLPWSVLKDLEADLGVYGYAGQIGQNPTPPGGGLFKTDRFTYIDSLPNPAHIIKMVRYWDKAGTQGGGAYTSGVKMCLLDNSRWVIVDVRRGQWAEETREQIIQDTAVADGYNVCVWIEQEPGSSGKEAAQDTIRNLAGYIIQAERPTGDKIIRSQTLAVQINNGNVFLLRGDWNAAFIKELSLFPYGKYKDQVDSCSGAFRKLVAKRMVRVIGRPISTDYYDYSKR